MKVRYLLLHAYGSGGTIRTVINQANSLVAAGHDIELVSVLRRKDEPQFPIDPRVRVTPLIDLRESATATGDGEAGARFGGLPGRFRAWRGSVLAGQRPRLVPEGEFGFQYFNRYTEKVLIRYLKGLTDGILVSTRPGLNILAARFAPSGLVRIAQEHMNWKVHRPDVREAISHWYPRFDAVAVLTHRDRQDYEKVLAGTKIIRIPNAVHSLDQEPSAYSNKIAVAAGRLFRQKGFDMLIPAFKKVVEDHPDWQLRIFGNGEKKADLRALIEKHHLYNHVFLMGHTDRLDEELTKASFYVLSSRFEGLPMVMIEAMAHALPVVSFDCPTGPADVITHGVEGLLVPAGDVDELAHAMGQLMDDESLRAEMGAAAVKTARSYSPAAVHPQWESLFTELVAAREQGGSGRKDQSGGQ